MLTFVFDTKSQRYRYTSGGRSGQFVGAKQITKLVEDYMIQQKADIATITDILLADKISVDTWQYGIAQALKSLHINAYSIGRGGIGKLTEADTDIISDRLKSEFGYLQKFAQDIADGKLRDAQIKNRMALYVDGAWSGWQTGVDRAAEAAGFRLEIWDAAGDKGTCVDCSSKAALGWQPLGTLGIPGVGVRCLSRCRCNKRFSKEENLLGNRDGWLAA